MKLLKGWKLRILTGLALATLGGQLQAQMKPGSMDPSLLSGQGPMGPASYRIPGPPPGMMQDPSMDPSVGMPPMGMDPNLPMAGYGPDGNGMEGMPCGPNCGGPDCGCGAGMACSDMFGRDRCGFWGGLLSKLGACRGKLRPYGEGGIATQRWFDIYGEAMFLRRTSGLNNFLTSTRGTGLANPVMSTDQVELNDLEAGLSLQMNFQTGPGSNLELVYFGLNNWEQTANVTSNLPNLFSFISNFGTTPVNGFDDSDRSREHTLSYRSGLNNGEINFRRRWSEPHGFIQGSGLFGVRYMDIDETATFTARGEFDDTFFGNSPRFLDYTTMTQNSLVGFQVGGDLWYNLYPGVKLGVEGKIGVYNNRAHQDTRIFGNSIPNTFNESVLANRCAYITQISPQLYYRLNYSWAIRSSYQVMFIDNVALAPENFNGAGLAGLGNNPSRVARINNDGEITLQGFTIGAEYMW
jgi:hypothetical protein